MEFKTKEQTAFDVNFEVAGPLVPVSSPAPSVEDWEDPLTRGVDLEADGAEEVIANRIAHREGLEPTVAELDQAYQEFDEEFPAIAETVREHQAFERKRARVFAGIRGQVRIAAASLMATAVVISGLGFVSQTTSPDVEPVQEETCMLKSDFSEGFECLD